MKRALLACGATVLAVVAGALGVGASLPASQEVSRELVFAAPPEAVWARMTDRHQGWRQDLTRVDIHDGRAWTEIPLRGPALRFEVVREDAPRRFDVRFAGGGVEGTWSGELAPAPGGGARLTLTERVTVASPPLRLVARLVGGPEAAVDGWTADLRAALAAGPVVADR